MAHIGNIRVTFFVFFLLQLLVGPTLCRAQVYKYLGTDNGLSNRRIYRIQKDGRGYMWFLTQEGMDRYDGRSIRHYTVFDGNTPVDSQVNLNWLCTDSRNTLWVIGKEGRVFHYDTSQDCFQMIYKLSGQQEDTAAIILSHAYMDRKDRIWLCYGNSIVRYDIRTGTTDRLHSPFQSDITAVGQTDSTFFFMGTADGLFTVREKEGSLEKVPDARTDSIKAAVSELYFHSGSGKLFIGTFKDGILVYDTSTASGVFADCMLKDIVVNRIIPLDEHELLVATGGKGVYKINVNTISVIPYITADYSRYNGMNGNNINDIYVDDGQRIWLANYPAGITVRNNRYRSYEWIRHSLGNSRSLVNDQVYDVIGDSEGDLWFATGNGISLQHTRTGEWRSFLSASDDRQGDGNHIFLTLCEVAPGIIWAGGYAPGIYRIDKKKGTGHYLPPSSSAGVRPDQYINDIKKDSEGFIWLGGCYNLKRIDPRNGEERVYPIPGAVTTMLEKDAGQMWIGTTMGLYQLDKRQGSCRHIAFPTEAVHVCALYQSPDSTLYVGTSGAGLLVYDGANNRFVHQYQTENCALISNNIHIIIPRPDGNMLIGTENGIVSFMCGNRTFNNWTAEQGLMSVCFNPGAATLHKGNFVFGSNDGAIMFAADMRIPDPHYSRMFFRDFMVSYRLVHPREEDSPLENDIDETGKLKLDYSQNTFSLEAVSINYDYPSNILYSWKLEGFYNEWSRPVQDGRIQFTSLSPGRYTLRIRTVSNEEKYKIYEERSIGVVVARPPWAGTWAITGYAVLLILGGVTASRMLLLRRQKKISDEKTRFFINTAHDIRTPLTLIKAPMEELEEKGLVKQEGVDNVRVALKSVDSLLHLVTDLINFERTDVYNSRLYIAEYELGEYLETTCETFRTYASLRNITLSLEKGFSHQTVWFDREKMDSVMKNILSNALKYTLQGGCVRIRTSANNHAWSVEVNDTGIGIPSEEQRLLFRRFFRGSNAVNMKVGGSGIGLMMVYKLVRLHGGKISINSKEGEGTCVRITFPMGKEHFRKARFVPPISEESGKDRPMMQSVDISREIRDGMSKEETQRILVVEDNDELRAYLEKLLGTEFHVQSCSNGRDALIVTREYNPDLILSDVMMPEMDGNEFCLSVKSDIETSHIPVILLTALSDEKNMLEGLGYGADAYISKPFSVNLLRATIRNILSNRMLLRRAYTSLDTDREVLPPGCSNTLNWKFIASVKECVMENIANPEFNVDTLCSMQHMSRSSFFNKLKTLTGCAPAEYIRSIRLQYAAQLLKQKDCPITEVADATGFNDVKYFREVFRKYHGISPSEYRKGNCDT